MLLRRALARLSRPAAARCWRQEPLVLNRTLPAPPLPTRARVSVVVGSGGLCVVTGSLLWTHQSSTPSAVAWAKEATSEEEGAEVSPETSAVVTPEEAAWQRRTSAMKAAWREALRHWMSMVALTMATLISTVIERVALAGQVQQLMQLPGQMPLENVVQHLAMVAGIKTVHLVSELFRHWVAHRLGQRLERAVRDHLIAARSFDNEESSEGDLVKRLEEGDVASAIEVSTATRLVLAEAAPRLAVEATYASFGALGALFTSPPLAVYFVAHEALVGQLVGFGAAYLARSRDRKSELAAQARGGPDYDAKQIAANDANAFLDRYVETGQIAGLASFVLTASFLIDRNIISPDKYQRVMMLASNAMQSSAELAQAAEKLHRGTNLLEAIHAFDAATHQPLFALAV